LPSDVSCQKHLLSIQIRGKNLKETFALLAFFTSSLSLLQVH
jgi:hypothetical protein